MVSFRKFVKGEQNGLKDLGGVGGNGIACHLGGSGGMTPRIFFCNFRPSESALVHFLTI